MSENLSIKGKITKVLEIDTGTSKAGKDWQKSGFVIDTGKEYNPDVCFSLFGNDKIDMINAYDVGQEVVVSFNVSSREFNGKYYHNLDAWRIQLATTTVSKGGIVDNAPAGDDDLPF